MQKKPVLRQLSALLCVALLAGLLALPAAAAEVTADHWAAEALDWAVRDGLLTGTENGLEPDGTVTGAQAVTILNRLLSAKRRIGDYPGVAPEAWYAEAASIAMNAGILPEDGSLDLEQPLTRCQAAGLLCAAFGLDQAVETGALDSSTDLAGLTAAQRRALDAMVAAGAMEGYEGRLMPFDALTRAQFVTLLYRLVKESGLTIVSVGTIVTNPQLTSLLFACDTGKVSVADEALQRLVIHSDKLTSLSLENVTADTLVLRQQNGQPELSGAGWRRVVFAGGGAAMTGGAPEDVEITASGAAIRLDGMQISALTICGSGNTLTLGADTTVDTLTCTADSGRNEIVLDGTARAVELAGSRNALRGAGHADTVTTRGEAEVTVDYTDRILLKAPGLTEAALSLTVPAVQPGGQLAARGTVSGVNEIIDVTVRWYLDGAPVSEETLTVRETAVMDFSQELKFTRSMPLSRAVALELEYVTPEGETQTLRAEETAAIQNYTAAQYDACDYQLASQVSGVYQGDYTESYNIDYSDEVKEAFVRYHAYTSRTDYLLWISRATQKVNVFEKDENGEWALTHTFRCGTGAAGTPEGVTYIFGKCSGWYEASYTVLHVVNFYPGTGFAFHSRLYYPGSTTQLSDPSIGFPVSHGCVRMYTEDVKWIWDTVPMYSTVVVY